MRTILRPNAVYGLKGDKPIPVGHSKFYCDYVLHDEDDPFVPGTDNKVPRLRAVPLGERAIGFFSDKIEELQEALSQLVKPKPIKPAVPAHNSKKKTRSRAA